MKPSILRFMILAVVCGMLAVSLSYSNAVAENGSDVYEVESYCTADTPVADTASLDESLLISDVPENEEIVPNSCYSCSTNEDCWLTPFTRDGYCGSFGGLGCCVFY